MEGVELVERSAELAQLSDAVTAVMEGRGGFLTLEGPAGIGKSGLLEQARRLAADTGASVSTARAGELEQDFPYGVIRQLLERPVRAAGGVAALDEAARHAAPALGIATGDADASGDRGFAVLHGVYWAVANLAAQAPLVLLVDDAHWADASSLRALAYLVSRLEGLPVLVVLAVRSGESGLHADLVAQLCETAGADRVVPAPLSAEAVSELVARRLGGPAEPGFAAACRDASGGNPFLLGELLTELARDGGEPDAARVGDLRPRTVARWILLRIGRVAPQAARLARAVALLGAQADPRRAAALAELEVGEALAIADALANAEVLARERPLRFLHPMIRAAILDDQLPSERSTMHARAARLVLDDGAPADEAAAHLLAVDPLSDPWVVEVLREAGRAALGRGAADAAQRFLRRALAEPPAPAARGAVLALLGEAELLAATEPLAAIEHLAEAVDLSDGPRERAARTTLLARARFSIGDVAGAVAALEDAVSRRAGGDREAELQLEVDLGSVGLLYPPTAVRIGKRLEGFAGLEGRTPAERLVLCNLAAWTWLNGTAGDTAALGERALDPSLPPIPGASDSIPFLQGAWTLAYADRHEIARIALDVAAADARSRGSAFGFAGAATMRAMVAWRAGELVTCEAEVRNVAAIGVTPPFVRPARFTYLTLALLERGRLDEAEEASRECFFDGYLPELVHMNPALYARGLLRSAQGRDEEALEDLLELGARDERCLVRNPGIPWRCAAARVLVRLGDRARARQLLDEHRVHAERWGTATALGVARHAEAILVDGEDRVTVLEEAASLLALSPARLDHARALADLGTAMRAAGQRAEARGVLRDAVEAARRCGATALAERAHGELEAVGERPQRLRFSGLESLTASERRVAEMAASGLTNREIAQALFVTAKTVENHLGRVYAKLDLKSRADLGAALSVPA